MYRSETLYLIEKISSPLVPLGYNPVIIVTEYYRRVMVQQLLAIIYLFLVKLYLPLAARIPQVDAMRQLIVIDHGGIQTEFRLLKCRYFIEFGGTKRRSIR